MKKGCRRPLLAATLAFLALAGFTGQTMAQSEKECQSLAKEIDDSVDKVARVAERMGTVEQWIEQGKALETNKSTLEKDKSTLRKTKLQVANLAENLCSCCGKKSSRSQRHKECDALLKQIDDLVDKVARVAERMATVEQWIEQGKALETNKSTLEKDKSTLRKTKLQIANVAEKLCACCARETGTTQQPTPSTTDEVTDALKTIGSSISIGIGGGSTGGHGRHDRITGEDRTRTADKLKTTEKSHTTSTSTPKKTTTSGKTVTAACKCHPCTCSPCTCH